MVLKKSKIEKAVVSVSIFIFFIFFLLTNRVTGLAFNYYTLLSNNPKEVEFSCFVKLAPLRV